jgi:DNA-binding response OmpR family regulator
MTSKETRVLVVDDELRLRRLLRSWLGEAGYHVVEAGDGLDGLLQFDRHRPALALIDIIMPAMDGMQLCQRLREVSDVPVILLTDRASEREELLSFERGADDYLAKPLDRRRLLARVDAALRRKPAAPPSHPGATYSDAFLRIDFARRQATQGDTPVPLTATEYLLLAELTGNAGRVVTHRQLLQRVWGKEYDSVKSAEWHVGRLRRKLGVSAQTIVSIRGVGYRYDPFSFPG